MTNFSHAANVEASCASLASTTIPDGPLILVVEGHEDARFLLRTLLEMRGMCVIEAEDGIAGVHAAEEFHPDLILMDWTLPRMDGLAAMRLIHERDSSDHIPIVCISGHATPREQAMALAQGCCEYLVKPFDSDQLDRVLRKHVLLRLVNAPFKEGASPSPPSRTIAQSFAAASDSSTTRSISTSPRLTSCRSAC